MRGAAFVGARGRALLVAQRAYGVESPAAAPIVAGLSALNEAVVVSEARPAGSARPSGAAKGPGSP